MRDKKLKKDRDQDQCKRIDTSRQVLEFFRRQRLRAVSLYAGDQWSRSAEKKLRYINLIALFVNIVTRQLVSSNPRASLSTFEQQEKAAVGACEQWLNEEIVRQNMQHKFERLAQDSMFSMATAMVALATPVDSARVGYGVTAGMPMLTRIEQDDLCYDYEARDLEEVSWIAWRFRGPIDAFKDSQFFDNKKARDRLTPMSQSELNREGDRRIHQLGLNDEGHNDDLEETVEAWACYSPRNKSITYYAEDNLSGAGSCWEGGNCQPLTVKKWVGHECGPLIHLAHIWVPGNLVPKGPVADLIDLDEGANESYRKLMREAAALKIQSVCDANNPQDGQALMKGRDGDMTPLMNPKAVSTIRTGGPDAGLFQWARENIDRFMEMAGGLRSFGGLSSEAGTLGQEEMLLKQSSSQVASYQSNMVTFVTKCFDSLLWYYWEHPELKMETPYQNPAVHGVRFTRVVYPWNHPDEDVLRRTGKKPSLRIDPYSLRHKTPQQRMQDLVMVMTQLYQPFAQLSASQGVTPTMAKVFQLAAKWIDMPELQDVLTITEPPQGEQTAQPQMPQSTSREYVRKDVGRGSGREQKMESDNAIAAMAAAGGGSSQLY